MRMVAKAGGAGHRTDGDLSRCERRQVGVKPLLSHNVLHGSIRHDALARKRYGYHA